MKKQIVIIGAGPAAMSLAAFLDPSKFEVSIYEQNKTAGRKFLVAGKGGFNLTHAEPFSSFIDKYKPAEFLSQALANFTNDDLRSWLASIGIPTFVGSSNRVYPEKGTKPIEVLNAVLKELKKNSVSIHYQHKWLGWTENGALAIKDLRTESVKVLQPEYTIFATGGASWKVTGSDGDWLSLFKKKGIVVYSFQAVNCAFQVSWPISFLKMYEGKPLKNLAIYCKGKKQVGEAVITNFGLEGNAVYGLSLEILESLAKNGSAKIYLDLKPMLTIEELKFKFAKSKEKKRSEVLRKSLNLNKIKLALLKAFSSKEDFLDDEKIISLIKALPIVVTGTAPIDEAISTIGGIAAEALNERFELKKAKNVFCIGEMVDWYAPTGGYLLQGCFSMGNYLASYLNEENIL